MRARRWGFPVLLPVAGFALWLLLTVGVIGIAVMLAFSPDAKLQWANHLMIANLLVFALMSGCLFEYVAIGVAYWRDRH